MKSFRRILSLVLALCLCFSLVVGASAEETAHNHKNELIWHFDETDGTLTISGTGTVVPLYSADEQPWASFREEITHVIIDPDAEYFAEDIAYWFDGCTNLVYAEVPGYWLVIGQRAFADCVNLQELLFLTHGVPDIADTAFSCENATDLWIMVNSPEAYNAAKSYNWADRNVEIEDYSGVQAFGSYCMNGCYCSSCTWSYAYSQRDEDYHWEYAKCNNCSATEYAYGSKRAHSFSGNTCTVCGYTKSSGSGGSSGGGSSSTCYHSRTYLEWYGCDWYEYCYYCDEFLDYGTSHGTYTYGSWSYYSSTQHRRYYSCSDCGEGSYEYKSHSTTNKYASYSDSQHSVTKYCATCGSNVGSTTYASHSVSYGSWSSYSSTQHRRTVSCATCGYSSYGYGNHADSNADGKCDSCRYSMSVTITWDAHTNGGSVNGVQSVTTSAPIGYSATAPSYTPVKTGHIFKGWYTAASGGSLYSSVSISAARTFYAQFTPSTYTITWNCGDGTTKTTTQTYGQALTLPAEPTRENYAFDGWYTASSGGSKVTASTVFTGTSNTTYYAHWNQTFSVTVPTSLPLVMDQHGNVTGGTAQIVNHSSGKVAVSAVTLRGENSWKIVPYATNMAHQKVDAKIIGFSLNGAATVKAAAEETLSLTGNWSIPQNGSLVLNYDAVVSAVSQAVKNEAVLSAIFVLRWS